ncbi:hypothetical protein Vadar_030535 [Vaccinium darrowii]|uniref:Uncharacterized protein n=1 Tax=Vaccinium darrowii TaxID=229202 RepID=A0ACB7XUE9_9ERIC|nr:hypothetical protein Vadar_030535 [Vaccinium darrowii]
MGYLSGTTKEPKVEDTLHPQWELENSTVMSWLLNSMELELSNGYLFMDTAKEIWDAVSQTYSQKGNMAQIYDLKCRIHNSKQRESSVAAYFHSLRSMWQELDFYQAIDMDSPADALKLKKLIEQERIIEFLAGLNGEYDPIIVQILGKEHLPSLHEGERVDEDKSLGPPSLSLPIIPSIQEQEMDKDLELQQEICVEESSRPLKVYSRRQKDVTGTPLLPRQSDSSDSGNPSSPSILEPVDVIHREKVEQLLLERQTNHSIICDNLKKVYPKGMETLRNLQRGGCHLLCLKGSALFDSENASTTGVHRLNLVEKLLSLIDTSRLRHATIDSKMGQSDCRFQYKQWELMHVWVVDTQRNSSTRCFLENSNPDWVKTEQNYEHSPQH